MKDVTRREADVEVCCGEVVDEESERDQAAGCWNGLEQRRVMCAQRDIVYRRLYQGAITSTSSSSPTGLHGLQLPTPVLRQTRDCVSLLLFPAAAQSRSARRPHISGAIDGCPEGDISRKGRPALGST